MPKCAVFSIIDEARPERLRDHFVLVIDVLRATSVMVTALDNGAARVYPVETVEQAFAKRECHPGALLCGERKAVKIEGFDLSNSPSEYTPQAVAGKELIMTTSNGTRAILRAVQGGKTVGLACFRNALAACRAAAASGLDVAILCAGTNDKYSMDDVLCAGALVHRLCALGDFELDDLANHALVLYRLGKDDIKGALSQCLHVGRVIAAGFAADLDYCYAQDVVQTLPFWRDGAITTLTEAK